MSVQPTEDNARRGLVAREQAFHDERFSHDGRPADSFYVVSAEAIEEYRTQVGRWAGPESQVLEYGCGDDAIAPDVADAQASVIGIDISSVALDVAAAGLARTRSVSFVQMDAHSLAFPDRTFDLVCGSGILHHLDLATSVEEVARVLQPDGRAVFFEPMGHNPLINAYRRFTPGQRTTDEHPLRTEDFSIFARHFAQVRCRYYVLTALLALPIRRTKALGPVLGKLQQLDRALMGRAPILERFAWTTVIELSEPRN